LRREYLLIGSTAIEHFGAHRSTQRGRPFVYRSIVAGSRQYRDGEFFRCVDLRGALVWQADAECCFQARKQFHALQAAQTQFVIEAGGWAEHWQCTLAAKVV